jgi:hypothetical protein
MLREDVRRAVEKGEFSVYAIEHVDDGMALLTGVMAGERDDKGAFEPGTVNRCVEETLQRYADSMRSFVARPRGAGVDEASSP